MASVDPSALTSLFRVDGPAGGLRLDRFLADHLREAGVSRERIKRLILDGKVLIDGRPARSPREALRPGSLVRLSVEPPSSSLTAETGELDILYSDATLVVLNKPAGLTVHPAPGRPTGTLAHRLLARFPQLSAQEGFRPGIVHRLDKDTSGLMLAALTEKCRLALSGMFAGHEVFKEYLALVRGVPESERGDIHAPIGRHPVYKTKMAVVPGAKQARSAWRVLYADPQGAFSLVAVRIFSGRTHQVRVHMQHIGHPLLGDSVYAELPRRQRGGKQASSTRPAGEQACRTAPRQMLHAWKLTFRHPLPEYISDDALPDKVFRQDNRLSFFCPPPEDFIETARICARATLPVVLTGMPGCGKSALLAALRAAGVPVFSADAEVARLYAPDGDGQRLLRAQFGARFVPGQDAPVDKSSLGAAMRESPALRREIEALLHPLVRHGQQRFWEEQERACVPFAVAEVPLYFETGRQGRDSTRRDRPEALVVGVHCPFPVRKERLTRIRGWSEETIAGIEAWQWPEEKKIRACDIVIDNTGTLEELEAQAAGLRERLSGICREREEAVARRLEVLWNDRTPG